MTDYRTMRYIGRHRTAFGVLLLVVSCSLLFPPRAEASKSQPAVIGSFSPASGTARVGDRVDLVLHLLALAAAPQVEVRFLLPSQVRAVRGSAPWFGSLAQGETVDLPLTVEILQAGEYSLGATVKSGAEMAGAVLNILATAQGVTLSTEPLFLMKLRQAPTLKERRRLLEGTPAAVAPPLLKTPTPAEQKLDRYFLDQLQQQKGKVAVPLRDVPLLAPTATTVSGVMHYKDSEDGAHPIRYALVQILNGATGAVLTETLTLSDGSYSVGVNADTVKVRVLTEDGLRSFARVFPSFAPTVRGAYTSPATPVSGPGTVVNITTNTPIRGTPGSPSVDDIHARAFVVFDALMQYQVQAFGLRGAFFPQVKVNFPAESTSYSRWTQLISLLREDALDWDVIGHEFFHFVTHQHMLAGGRPIDNNPGGPHSGGSAIGEAGRDRDEGLRLAWAEGLATFMSVRLQSEAASTAFGMTWPVLPKVGDTRYTDTEDSTIDNDLESIEASEGFASEHSVMAMLWDFTDTPGDSASPGGPGQAADQFDLTAKTIWDLITTVLPCNPCDRVDRFWNAVVALVGVNPSLLAVAETFAMNNIAPELTGPADGFLVSGGVSPTFQWNANGDPSPAHRPNRFSLVISTDNFQSDFHVFPTNGQSIQTTQYQIPDADFQALVSGATTGTIFRWVVVGWHETDGDIRIPDAAGVWLSNSRGFQAGG